MKLNLDLLVSGLVFVAVGILSGLIIFSILYGLTWVFCWAFSIVFSVKYVFGVWVVVIILNAIKKGK
jgi:hypothetical protein